MKSKRLICLICFLFLILGLQAQNVTVSPTGINPISTHPRLSYDAVLALPNPQQGDIAYDSTFKCLRVYMGNQWLCSHQNPNEFTPNVLGIASAGGTSFDKGNDVAVDTQGNVYITGYFNETANFSGISITSMGNGDVFVAKYNSKGTLQWVQSAGGTLFDEGRGIVLDIEGNIYITGTFNSSARFGNISITSAGYSDAFVAKYNNNGNILWVKQIGGISYDVGNDIKIDTIGNVYVAGSYTNNSTYIYEMFIYKYTNNGTFQWSQSAKGKANAYSIAVDKEGNQYVTGLFEGTAIFGTTTKTAVGEFDIFIAKYNSAGVFQWVQSAGGTGEDYGDEIAVDSIGNVYITGSYSYTSTFGSISKISSGGYDVFIAKYNSNGVIQWVQSGGSINSEYAYGIAIDAGGNLYITGHYYGTTKFENISKSSLGRYSDVYVVKYNTTGALQWVLSSGGIGEDYGSAIAIDSKNNIYVTGYFYTSGSFGYSALSSAGVFDIFIIRLDN